MSKPVKTISDWASRFEIQERPWLILGKGPSFERFNPQMAEDFFVLGLNHIVRQTAVTLAHFIDIDAFADCSTHVLAQARWVAMPWHPHERFFPSRKTLSDYCGQIPALEQLRGEGRLLCYNLTSGDKFGRLPDAPLIEAKFFSAEAALNLLAECGVRMVRSLGVDGGTRYSTEFDDLAAKTRLANGQPSFDLQFSGIARTIRTAGVDYAPLYVDTPVRVFVGADSTQALPYRVLEFSTKKHASLTVEFQMIDNKGIRVPVDPSNQSRTGFSFSRFKIPSLCDYRGRAIYLDADMQVFSDILDLWVWPFDGASMLYAEHDSSDGRVPQFSVLLLNCDELDWDPNAIIGTLDAGRHTYESLMYRFDILPLEKKRAALPKEWNSLEHYVPGTTRLLHYTDMPTQPWINRRNRNWHVWIADLKEALQEGFISPDFVLDQIERGHVSPALPRWLGMRTPAHLRRKARDWVPPYRQFVRSSKGPLASDISLHSRRLRSGWARVLDSFRGLTGS